jgi:hypothetical protein
MPARRDAGLGRRDGGVEGAARPGSISSLVIRS